ncbi:MAG: tail fiber domain-containing protein [Desulfurellales bacterium]|nr:MAG: tail fiber domain-containing protein [Desulfurellales bacterium]
MDSPSPPPAPDPYATAAAQAQMNKETAITQAGLNRIDQTTPQGTLTYAQTGKWDDGTPRFSQTQTYSPVEQAKYDQQNKVTLGLGDLAVSNINRVNDAQSKPFSYDGMTPLQTSVGAGLPALNYGSGQPYTVKDTIGNTGAVKDLPFGVGGPVQGQLDYSNLTALPGTNDFSGDAKRVADSVYSQATSRLDPQFQQSESDMRARLAAQGISENSDAYRREMDNFARSRNDAYNQAAYSAQQAGSNEQSRIFGLALNARQQGQNEANTAGTFRNTAQQQQFGQAAATTDQNNQAQDQRTQQAMAIAEMFNQAQQQRFSQDQAGAAFNNATRAQAFNEDSANATLNNSGRQQQINEATYLRNLPLNDIAALLGAGNGVQNPTFQPVPQVGVAAPDYQGIVQNNYNQAMNQYNQKLASQGGMLGSLFGLGGTLGAAAISDRRLKRNIRRIGQLANGIATYTYRYVGSKAQQFGVMAQEVLGVRPSAVGVLPNGTMFVKYSEVY